MTSIIISSSLNNDNYLDIVKLSKIKENNISFININNENDFNDLNKLNINYYLIIKDIEEQQIKDMNIHNKDNCYNIIYVKTIEDLKEEEDIKNNLPINMNDMKYILYDNITIEDIIDIVKVSSEHKIYNEKYVATDNHDMFENYIYIIGACFRLNVMTYITNLEKLLIEEDEYIDLDIFILNHTNEKYILIGFPSNYFDFIIDYTKTTDFKLTPGRPVSSENGPLQFNYNDKYVYTLEYISELKYNFTYEELQNKLHEELLAIKNSI